MNKVDTTRLPTGERSTRALLDALAQDGDIHERHFLEVKSTLDLSSKEDQAKIAKFILGTSNRRPETAERHFEGYALMVIGVGRGHVPGITPVEMKDVAQYIEKFTGTPMPHWDYFWVDADTPDNKVLLVKVDPPRQGQTMFPCRSDGPDGLKDGRIFFRHEGETREATATEIDMLLGRGTGSQLESADFEVSVNGRAAPVCFDEEKTLIAYLEAEENRLLAALPEQRPTTNPLSAAAIVAATPTFGTAPEDRTQEEYVSAIKDWRQQCEGQWDTTKQEIAAASISGTTFRIVNKTDVFLSDVEVRIEVESGVQGLAYTGPELPDLNDLGLPNPPRPWGPRSVLGDTFGVESLVPTWDKAAPISVNALPGGGLTLVVKVGDLRPRGSYTSSEDPVVLIATHPLAKSLTSEWTLTARGHDKTYKGSLQIPVAEQHDLTHTTREALGLPRLPSGNRTACSPPPVPDVKGLLADWPVKPSNG